MRVLVLGNGARQHALAARLSAAGEDRLRADLTIVGPESPQLPLSLGILVSGGRVLTVRRGIEYC